MSMRNEDIILFQQQQKNTKSDSFIESQCKDKCYTIGVDPLPNSFFGDLYILFLLNLFIIEKNVNTCSIIIDLCPCDHYSNSTCASVSIFFFCGNRVHDKCQVDWP